MRSTSRPARTRLSSVRWLRGGLEALCEQGVEGLLTEPLAARLGVTTGSFYWHFKDRDDFYTQLLEYWSQQVTDKLIEDMEASHLSPLQQLYESFARIIDEQLGRYEAPVRAWALTNPKAKQETAKVDRRRIAYVSNLFGRLGFQGAEREMRARTLLLVAMAEPSLFLNDSLKRRKQWLKLRLDMLAGAPGLRPAATSRASRRAANGRSARPARGVRRNDANSTISETR